MINAIKKKAKDIATKILFSFLNPIIPIGIPIKANAIFGSSQCIYLYAPDFIWKINTQKPKTKKAIANKVSIKRVFFL